MAELQLGKYEFYPYEFERSETPTLEELMEWLEKAKSRSRKDIKTPTRSTGKRQPRRGFSTRGFITREPTWLGAAKRGKPCERG